MIPEGRATISVAHEKALVAEFEQVRGQAPNPDGAGLGPRTTPVHGLALQGFPLVVGVVIPDVDHDSSIGRLDGVKLMIVLGLVSGAGGNLG